MKSMKKPSLLSVFILTHLLTYAQLSFNAKVDMKVGNYSSSCYDAKIGFKAGMGMEYAFTDIWSLQPSLMLSTKGSKQKIDLIVVEGHSIKNATWTNNHIYLELPIMAAARLPVTINLDIVFSAGPYIAYGIGGKMGMKPEIPGESQYNTFGGEGYKRFDAGLGFGIAGEFYNIIVGIDSQFGLTKLHNGNKPPKNQNFSVYLGYKF